jgi:proline iminopeptidase
VFDSIVRLDQKLYTEIPATPRWEERLNLHVRRVRLGDAELYVEEEGSGIPLVLLHGGPGGTHHGFHPWFGRAREFARVIYYDQRGCGLSDYEPDGDGYSVEQAVEDLDGLRQALGIEKFVLLGFSYGGFLAQYYTTTYPQNVAGLVLVGASPGMWSDLGSSRQRDFMFQSEIDRMREIRTQLRELRTRVEWDRAKYVRLLVYNNHINGDWKRQHLFKPSPERMAQTAFYEWVHDDDFNPIMNESAQKVDLTGAFDRNPIPTLIMEGEWDLTWGVEKKDVLIGNHPNARVRIFENGGHSIYNEDTKEFFSALAGFLRELPDVDAAQMAAYQKHLEGWRTAWRGSPLYHLKAAGWGRRGNQEVARAYRREWLQRIEEQSGFLKLGFALYDAAQYEEALLAFQRLEEVAREEETVSRLAVALIWQGHMLDLLGRREDAVVRYQQAVDMNLDSQQRHDQYALSYNLSPYAAERLVTPFQRMENTWP